VCFPGSVELSFIRFFDDPTRFNERGDLRVCIGELRRAFDLPGRENLSRSEPDEFRCRCAEQDRAAGIPATASPP